MLSLTRDGNGPERAASLPVANMAAAVGPLPQAQARAAGEKHNAHVGAPARIQDGAQRGCPMPCPQSRWWIRVAFRHPSRSQDGSSQPSPFAYRIAPRTGAVHRPSSRLQPIGFVRGARAPTLGGGRSPPLLSR